ncbi:MAG: peptidase T [Clostridia bacterium]|nr:peptidase T [Clostridia bacterium]
MSSVKERFLRYVQVETTSCEANECCPSTPGQKVLGEMLVKEMQEIGVTNARMDEHGYVYGYIPAKGKTDAPAIGLIAHMDTSDAVPGKTVPQEIKNYDGGVIRLKNGGEISGFSFLKDMKGQDLIVTSGDSVLGADDKAGVAEIMALCEKLLAPDAPDHGKICVAFTPDEEIGRGADLFDIPGFGAEIAYTVDGGALGELEYECFNAASGIVKVTGVNIHPGSAKNQMINASLVAMEFAGMLPPWERPEHTEGYEGFYHLMDMKGNEEVAELKYILRDHDSGKLEGRKQMMKTACEVLNRKYGEGTVRVELKDSYRNMKEIVEQHPEILERAKKAFLANGVEPIVKPIRGGTDGAQLSFRGLPCPNLSTGGYNFHGRKELVSVQAMESMVRVLISLTSSAS